MSQMDRAIEELYVAFDDVPAPRHMIGCPCCTGDDEFTQLLGTPRRELTVDDLSRYARKAISTQGTTADYLHFFPRIVELLLAERGWIESEIVFGKIGETSPETWPARRRSGLEAFLLAMLDDQARANAGNEHYVYGMVMDELVCCVGLSGVRLGPWLSAVLSYPDALRSFYEQSLDTLDDGRLRNAFWGNTNRMDINKLHPNLREIHRERHERRMRAQAEVVAWLRSDEVEKVVFGLAAG